MPEFRGFLNTQPMPEQSTPARLSGFEGLSQLIATGVEVGHKTYLASKRKELEGQEVKSMTELPGLENTGLPEGESRQSMAEKLKSDQLNTLQKIKFAREQGLISASRADLLTNKAIRRLSSSVPGTEDELRKTAAEFFGTFGPGDHLLEETSTEATNDKIRKEWLTAGVKAGIINPNDPTGDVQGQSAWFKISRDKTLADIDLQQAQSQAAWGGIDVNAYGNKFIASKVEYAVADIAQHFAVAAQKGEKIKDETQISAIIQQKESALIAELNKGLSVIPGAKREDIDKQIAAVKSRFSTLQDLAKKGSLQTFLKDNYDMMVTASKLGMATKFPQLFAAEQAFPHLAAEMLKMALPWQNMSPAQRDLMLQTYPPYVRDVVRFSLESQDHTPFLDVVMQGLSSQTRPSDQFAGTYMDTAALNMGRGGDPNASNDDISANNKAVQYVLKNITSPAASKYLTEEPAVAARIRNSEENKALLKNRMIAHNTNVDLAMQGDLGDEGGWFKNAFIPTDSDRPIGDLEYNKDQKRFEIKFNKEMEDKFQADLTPEMHGPNTITYSKEEQLAQMRSKYTPSFVKNLNSLNKLVEEYGYDLGWNPEQWRKDQIDKFYQGVSQVIADRETKRISNMEKPKIPQQ